MTFKTSRLMLVTDMSKNHFCIYFLLAAASSPKQLVRHCENHRCILSVCMSLGTSECVPVHAHALMGYSLMRTVFLSLTGQQSHE